MQVAGIRQMSPCQLKNLHDIVCGIDGPRVRFHHVAARSRSSYGRQLLSFHPRLAQAYRQFQIPQPALQEVGGTVVAGPNACPASRCKASLTTSFQRNTAGKMTHEV